jgi:cobalt/nickel transport system permease protein
MSWNSPLQKLTQIGDKGKGTNAQRALTVCGTFACKVRHIGLHCTFGRLQVIMHIPDGFLDAKTAIATGLFSITGLSAALRRAGRQVQSRKIPLIGLAAAFIFVAQMLNFPVAGGTSGHLLGSTLAAVLLGPSAAIIVMSSVLIVQALIFADGGVLALGANIFNMGIVAPLCGYGVYKVLRSLFHGEQGRLVAVGFASWFATVVAAIFCAGELAWSGTANWGAAFPAMAGVHMLTGLGEAAITMVVIAAISKTRPELLNEHDQTAAPEWNSAAFVYFALIVIGVLLLVAPHASRRPDGLEKVASSLGFEHRAAETPVLPSPLKDYQLPGVHSAETATIAAGVIGAIAVFALSFLLARVLARRPQGTIDHTSPARRQ